jgi:anti-sigma regulatory factor (Ser/Thr protein kinase)
VRLARLVAGAAARRCGVDEDVLDEVRLAVGEACARAVLRHQNAETEDPVVVELTDSVDWFRVRVFDRVDPSASVGDDDDSLALALISSLAPESAVEPVDNGSVIEMAWPVESLPLSAPQNPS